MSAALLQLAEALDRAALRASHLGRRRKLDALVNNLQPHLGRLWRRQGHLFVAGLKEHRNWFREAAQPNPNWLPLWLAVVRQTQPDWWRIIAPYLEQAQQFGLDASQEQLGDDLDRLGVSADFSLANPRAADYLRQRQIKLGQDIDATTADRIDTLMRQAVDEGWSIQQAGRAITDEFAQFSSPSTLAHLRTRAELVATTEIGNAYVQANKAVAKDVQDKGLTVEKSWIAVDDDRTDEDCSGNAGAGWIDEGDTFPSGDSEPLAHPGCRCDIAYRVVTGGDDGESDM